MGETSRRILAKALTFRVLTTAVTMFIVFILTGSLHVALGIGILDAVLRFVLYFIHEKAWNDVQWGILTAPEIGKQYKKVLNHRLHHDDQGRPNNAFYAFSDGVHNFEKQIAGMFTGKKK